MAKRTGRDDELPDLLYKLTPDEEARITRSLGESANGLGRPETVLSPPLDFLGSSPAVTGVVALMMLVGVVAIPILMKRLDPKQPDYDSELLAGSIAWYVFTGFFVLLAGYTVFLLTRPWWRRGERWFFFRDGVVRTNFGAWPLVFRWEDLKAYKLFHGPLGDRYEFQGAAKKPARVYVSRFLSRALPEGILDRHILAVGPRMLRQIGAGEEVKFGPFSLSGEVLAFKDKLRDQEIGWEDIDRIEVESLRGNNYKPEMIVRAGKARWVSADLSAKVPNAWLMLWLVRKVRPKLVRDFDGLRDVLS
jgi:hypothetical protein